MNYRVGKLKMGMKKARRNNISRLLSIIFLGAAVHVNCYADSDSHESFSISNKSPLSVSLLNNLWDNRENEKNQQVIINYLKAKPEVPANYEIAWKTARLVYFAGNYGVGEKMFINPKTADFEDAEDFFEYGINAAEKAMKLNPSKVEGFYWYAIDLGSWGLAKGIVASAWHAKDGMNALKSAMKIDPTYHWYGSSRILGRYYQELPGMWGGDKDKAKELFIQATTKAPKFDNNWVYLGQFYNSQGDYNNGLKACQQALSISPSLDGQYEETRYKREAQKCVDANKAKQKIAKS